MWNFTLHVRLRPKTCSIVQRWCFIRFIAVGLSAVLDSRLVTRYIDNHTGNTYDRSEWAPYGNLRMLLCNYKADQNVAVSNSCHTQVVVEKCVWQSDMKLWVWKRKQTKRVGEVKTQYCHKFPLFVRKFSPIPSKPIIMIQNAHMKFHFACQAKPV